MIQSQGNNFFDASDIERYHSGKMSAEERHALEKAALDDPFLADAIEGYAFTTTPADDLMAIKERLQEKSRRKNVVPLFTRTWMKVAAILVVVAGGVWLLLNTQNTASNKLAVEESPRKDNAESQTAPVQNSNADSVATFQTLTDSKSPVQNNTDIPRNEQATELPVTAESSVPATPEDNNDKTKNQSSKESNARQLNQYATIERTEQKDLASGATANARNNRNLSEMNRTIPQANVQDRPANNQVIANRVRSQSESDSASNFLAQNRKQSDTITRLDVVMTPQPSAPLNEVVVSKSVAKKETDMKGRMAGVIIDTLEPAEGWTNFDDYIAGNLKVPDELKQKPISSGEVELSFEVNQKGEPINITVVKSLCAKCDEEAKRLLREGPKWKKKKNKKGRVTIRF